MGPKSFALNDEGLCPESYYSNTLRAYALGAYFKCWGWWPWELCSKWWGFMPWELLLKHVEGLWPVWYHMYIEVVVVAYVECCVVVDALLLSSNCQWINKRLMKSYVMY